MTKSGIKEPGSPSRVGVSWSDGVVRLRDQDLFGAVPSDRCISFLHHVFTLQEVEWVELDRNESSAQIHYDVARLQLPEFLVRLAKALRASLSHDADLLSKSLTRDLTDVTIPVRIQKFGTILTTWKVIYNRPGRLRVRHPAIYRNSALANRLKGVIDHCAGVIEYTVHPVTGSVLIQFDPDLTSATILLQMLDHARCAPEFLEQVPPDARPAHFGLANTSLALAVTGELAAPFLLPASAVLLVGSNLHTFRAAMWQLLRGRFGLPVLYTSIVAVALLSGQFIASATMSWMFTFWSTRYRNDLINARRRLLGQIIEQPYRVKLATPEAGKFHVELSIEDLRPNDIIVVSAGEKIPVDGRVLGGQGLVDERMISGFHGLSRKQPDDEVVAGSTLHIGELHIQVLRQGPQTRVARLARTMLEATTVPYGSRTPTLCGETFAERTVAPTLAIAGLGLLIGDVMTAGAILRPDYATGPGVAFPLETLQAIALCLRHGILIRSSEAIERLTTVDLLVVEHHPALEFTELEVNNIEVFPGYFENDLLRYAATAFRDLDDPRGGALTRACQMRAIALLDLQLTECTTDLSLVQGNDRIKIGDLGTRAGSRFDPDTKTNIPDSLMVGINGHVAGLIHFRRSNRLEVMSTLHRLRAKRKLQVGIISEKSQPSLSSLMTSLDTDFYIDGLSADDRIQFLQNCRSRGFKVAYVGGCHIDPQVTAAVHLTISLGNSDPDDLDHKSAPICVLQPRMTKLAELWDIASIHQRRLQVSLGYALIPNLACIAGAFVWGFTSLASVVVTNLGTYCVYSRTAASIRSLEHQISRSSTTQTKAPKGNRG